MSLAALGWDKKTPQPLCVIIGLKYCFLLRVYEHCSQKHSCGGVQSGTVCSGMEGAAGGGGAREALSEQQHLRIGGAMVVLLGSSSGLPAQSAPCCTTCLSGIAHTVLIGSTTPTHVDVSIFSFTKASIKNGHGPL